MNRTWTLMLSALLAAGVTEARELPLERIELPEGFRISVYADDVPNARSLRLGPEGTVFVGNRSGDTVYALTDADGDHHAEHVRVIDDGLAMPNGLAVHQGDLYVATTRRILRYPDIEEALAEPPVPEVVRNDLPAQDSHAWRYLAIGPDAKIYVTIGAPCNVCRAPGHALIQRMNRDGSGRTVHARGVRNSIGMDWDPITGDLWFTDNGRDRMGDNRPPDELNHATEPGQHFGFPDCHGRDIPDPDLPGTAPCDQFRPPAQALGPHVAALGMRFYTGSQFPAAYRNQIFIAEHGSWNRSEKIGYRVTLVRLNADRQPSSYETFASGWLEGKRAWGRPVDVLVMPDGALLVSDDLNGAVYRIAYDG